LVQALGDLGALLVKEIGHVRESPRWSRCTDRA
jgi:hypothetical protein